MIRDVFYNLTLEACKLFSKGEEVKGEEVVVGIMIR